MARDDLPLWALAVVAIVLLVWGLGSCDDLRHLPRVPYRFDS